MTYAVLKFVTAGLLTGDNKLPTDEDVLLGLVGYALTTVATTADSLHLMTLSTDVDVLRLAQGDYLIRRPVSPILPTDELDIDEELGFAVARLLAGMVSKEKGGIHNQAATRIILDYNSKVFEIIDQMAQEALVAELTAEYIITDNTEFSL